MCAFLGDKMDNFKYMNIALKEAQKSLKSDDIPVGAVIVKNDKIISYAHNQKEKNKISTYHAEILAIEKACRKLKTWYLNDCTLYVTLEPCMMCCGAIIQSRMKKVVYATENPKFGYAGSIENLLQDSNNNHYVEIEKNVCKREASDLLINFFKEKRK